MGDTVAIYCTTVCETLTLKWFDFMTLYSRYIVSYDSLSFSRASGITIRARHLSYFQDRIQKELGRNLVENTERALYYVDTRDFIMGKEPYMCPCGLSRPSSGTFLC